MTEYEYKLVDCPIFGKVLSTSTIPLHVQMCDSLKGALRAFMDRPEIQKFDFESRTFWALALLDQNLEWLPFKKEELEWIRKTIRKELFGLS